MSTNNSPFAPNAREKVLYVKMRRAPGGKQYEVERVKQLDITNQYEASTRQINKREVTRELRNAYIEVA
ncbi:hypothetical protein H8E06_01245 [bacterium]|nr:hypothetical protein [bacterium]